MDLLKVKIITPKKIVKEVEANAVTLPTDTGEITVLPHHVNLFSLLVEGLIKIRKGENEEYLAIGGGYLHTDGSKVDILVSRAYHQNEIDEKMISNALENAKKIIKTSSDEQEKAEAFAMMRRAIVSTKLLKKRKPKSM